MLKLKTLDVDVAIFCTKEKSEITHHPVGLSVSYKLPNEYQNADFLNKGTWRGPATYVAIPQSLFLNRLVPIPIIQLEEFWADFTELEYWHLPKCLVDLG